MTRKTRLLVNLPPTAFTTPWMEAHWRRLRRMAMLRQRSHDTPEQILPDLKWAEAVIMWAWPSFDAAMLNQCPSLKFVGAINGDSRTVHECFKRGITLSETRHCWSPAVAEMALTLMLNGLRRISDYHAAMRVGAERWMNEFPGDIDPLERQLAGRAVGLVGFGGIGRRLAELLAPFHVKLLVYDPYASHAVLKGHGAQPVTLGKLIQTSEIVVLCAAVTPETTGMVNRQLVGQFRKNAVLVNIGRSALIDMAALEKRLRRNDMIAMLDVFDSEPLEADSPLRQLPNAYLTPHRAGGLVESVSRALTWLTDDFEHFLKGQPVKYAVTKEILPAFPL